MTRAVVLVAALLLVAAACGRAAPTLDARVAISQDTRGGEAVSARLAATPPDAPSPLSIVATTAGGVPEIARIALSPTPSVRWRRSLIAEARPELLGDAVVVRTAGKLLVLDDATGKTRLELPLPGKLFVGAAREGETIAVAVREASEDGQPARTHVIAFDAHSGAIRFRHDSDAELGRPVARSGMLLLPWERQGIIVLDLRDGHELAFLRSQDDVIDFVVADDDDVWFGHRTLYALSRRYDGTRATARPLRIATESLPGRPAAFESAYAPRPAVASAHGRIALILDAQRAAGDADPTLRADRAYFVFYRHVFAYDGRGALRWARSLPRDVIAARALPAGLLALSDDGTLSSLAAGDGALLASASLQLPLAAAGITGNSDLALAGVAGMQMHQRPPLSLRQGLLEIALDLDQRLLPARALAVTALAALPDPEVTRDLLDIYARSTTPPELSRVVADALRARRIGLEHAIDALLTRYDFLEETRPAPLAVLAPALVDADERRALPYLLARMLDHETPLAVLPSVVHAVVELGDATVVPPLLGFLRLYRNDSSFDAAPDALVEAARGVLRHGGEGGPTQLGSVTSDGHARPALASAVAALLAPPPAAASPETVAASAPPPAPALPATLSRADVAATFRAHEPELRACLQAELAQNPKLAQLRVSFVAESDGSAHAFQVTPASAALGDCLYPKLAGYRFPRFAAGRRLVRHTLALTRAAYATPAEPSAASDEADATWWSRAAKHVRKTDPLLAPWWQSAHPIAPLVMREPPPASAPTPAPSATPAAPAAPAPNGAAPPPASSTPAPTPSTEPAPPANDAWWVPVVPPPPKP